MFTAPFEYGCPSKVNEQRVGTSANVTENTGTKLAVRVPVEVTDTLVEAAAGEATKPTVLVQPENASPAHGSA